MLKTNSVDDPDPQNAEAQVPPPVNKKPAAATPARANPSPGNGVATTGQVTNVDKKAGYVKRQEIDGVTNYVAHFKNGRNAFTLAQWTDPEKAADVWLKFMVTLGVQKEATEKTREQFGSTVPTNVEPTRRNLVSNHFQPPRRKNGKTRLRSLLQSPRLLHRKEKHGKTFAHDA